MSGFQRSFFDEEHRRDMAIKKGEVFLTFADVLKEMLRQDDVTKPHMGAYGSERPWLEMARMVKALAQDNLTLSLLAGQEPTELPRLSGAWQGINVEPSRPQGDRTGW